MKKMFVLLWCALAGCTIVPEGSFDSPPGATLKGIKITANEGQAQYADGLPVSSLTATASHSGNRTTLTFQGSLDPFWFTPRVDKVEYEFNSVKLVSDILITFQGGGTQREEFSYNTDGNLESASISYVTGSGTDVKYEYDFFYVNRVSLDSISKKVTLVNTSTEVITGFLKAVNTEEQFTSTRRFFSIFPYAEGKDDLTPISSWCGGHPPTEYYNKSSFDISRYKPFNYLQYWSVVNRENTPYSESDNSTYSSTTFPYIGKQRAFSQDMANTTCVTHLHGISLYRLVPEMSFNLAVLEMLNIAEERYWVNMEPERLTPYKDIKVQFEYNYAE